PTTPLGRGSPIAGSATVFGAPGAPDDLAAPSFDEVERPPSGRTRRHGSTGFHPVGHFNGRESNTTFDSVAGCLFTQAIVASPAVACRTAMVSLVSSPSWCPGVSVIVP